jgi:predicted Ser/Thr protein kinase
MTDAKLERFLRELARTPAIAPAKELTGTGRFAVERRLGEGTFGEVYAAVDRQSGDRVALKRLKSTQREWLLRFKREFRILQGLAHPNLVRLHDLVVEGDETFLAMELIEGVDLLDHLARRPDRLRPSLAQLVAGLAALHGAGVIHRDVKPANVLVEPDGRVVLLDFGLASELCSDVSTALAGTPRYMAPEQRRGARATAAGDWYSVGVVFHEALTGKPPADDVRRDELAAAPADLASLTTALLSPDPAQRPTGPELLRRLAAESAPQARSPELFLARAEEVALLAAELARVGQGRPRTVLVTGESGIGKSSLLQAFVGAARGQGALVLTGRCYERESLPFKALDGIVDELARYLAHLPDVEVAARLPRDAAPLCRLFPVLGQVDVVRSQRPRSEEPTSSAEALRSRAVEALRELLVRVADRVTLAIVVDDLQWGDADSATLLAELLGTSAAPAALFVGTYGRTGETGPFVGTWRRLRQTTLAELPERELALGALSDASATRLAAARLVAAGRSPATAPAIAAEARGHPYFIGELALHASDGSALRPTLQGVVADRVARLPTPARRLLELVAVSDRPVEPAVALAALGLAGGLADALGHLRHARMIQTVADGQLTSAHDRTREAVLASLPDDRRRQLHAGLAAALEHASRPDHERIARHLRGAGQPERAVVLLADAADAARDALAFDHAARLYREAMILGSRSAADPIQAALGAKHAEALASAGRVVEAADAFLTLAASAVEPRATRLRCRAGEELIQSGHLERGELVLGATLTSLGISAPRSAAHALGRLLPLRARLRARGLGFTPAPPGALAGRDALRLDMLLAVFKALIFHDPIAAFSIGAELTLRALDAGEPARAAEALAIEALSLASLRDDGRRRRSRDALARAAALTLTLDTPESRITFDLYASLVPFLEGRWPEALTRLRASQAQMARLGRGSAWHHMVADLIACNTLFWMGRFEEMGRSVEPLCRRYLGRGNQLAFLWASLYAGWAELGADRADHAAAQIERALAAWTGDDLQIQRWWRAVAEVSIALYRGQGAEAWARHEESWPRLRPMLTLGTPYHRVEARWFRARAAVAAASGAPLPLRRRLAQEALSEAKLIERERTDLGDAVAVGLRADLAALDVDRRGGLERLDRQLALAARRLGEARLEAAHASACLVRARLLGGNAGRADLSRAQDWMKGQSIVRPEAVAAIYLPAAARLVLR